MVRPVRPCPFLKKFVRAKIAKPCVRRKFRRKGEALRKLDRTEALITADVGCVGEGDVGTGVRLASRRIFWFLSTSQIRLFAPPTIFICYFVYDLP